MSRARRRAALDAVLERSGAVELLGTPMPCGGRPRQLSAKAVLLGMLFGIDEGRPAHLSAACAALDELCVADQVRLGVVVTERGELREASYRQFAHTHQVMVRAIDPTPAPSFKGVADADRAAHLEAVRRGVDREAAQLRLTAVLDALCEASVPERFCAMSSSLAIDWTDHETWSRPRAKDDPQPANDPTASWGHAKGTAPGEKEHLFFGYYPQVATMVADERGPLVPEFIRRIAFAAPRSDPAHEMADTLVRAYGTGVPPGDVLADCGYSNRDPATFALPLRRKGARLVMDLHPSDRGPKGTHKGMILANGNCYCPATPPALLEIGPLVRGATKEETAAHDERTAELARYKLGRVARDNGDGAHRVMCPARLGKVRCPLAPTSMTLDFSRPEVLSPPEHPPMCCAQKTVTVEDSVNAKTRQKHDYASKVHRQSYNRRTASERSFSWMKDAATAGVRRGWCRMFGLAKNALVYALAVVVHNVRLSLAHEDREAKEARRQAMGLAPLRRRRRRRGAQPGGDPVASGPQTGLIEDPTTG